MHFRKPTFSVLTKGYIIWLDRAATELPVELLSDDQVLALRDIQMKDAQQAELSELLARQREGILTNVERGQLETLIGIYRRGMVRKAQALKVAVDRSLQSPFNKALDNIHMICI